MKELIIIPVVMVGTAWLLGAFEPKDPNRYKAAYEASCKQRWEESGFKTKLSSPYKVYANSNELGWYCLVNIDNRWVREDVAKVVAVEDNYWQRKMCLQTRYKHLEECDGK